MKRRLCYYQSIRSELYSCRVLPLKAAAKSFLPSVISVPHLRLCLCPGVCGRPLLCRALCCRCVCSQGCQTSGAFCREEWHLRSLASFHAGGPLLDGSWMSIWESVDTSQTLHYNLLSFIVQRFQPFIIVLRESCSKHSFFLCALFLLLKVPLVRVLVHQS